MDIVLVEDNPADVELTLHVLRKQRLGNRIHVLRDGAEAVDFILSDEEVGLILLDLMLPKMSGFEVLQILQANRKTRDIPVVVLTDSMESPNIVESLRLGARGYMVKPIDFAKLVDTAQALGLHWRLFNPASSPAE